MISINPVFQVLVTKGNQAVAAAGLRPDQLLAGQVGVFNYATGLTIDGTVLSQNRAFFIAVGVNRSGGTSAEDINKSAGEKIDLSGIKAWSIKPYAAAVNQNIQVTVPSEVLCNTEYGIKINLANAQAYANYGYNTPSFSYFAKTPCCTDPCTVCGNGDANALVQGLANSINIDQGSTNGFITASFVDPVSGLPVTDVTAWENGQNSLTPATITSATPSGTGGTLAAGTHTYALVDINADGFTQPGPNISATTTGTTGSVALVFPVADASVTERRLYRGTVAGVYTTYVTVATPTTTTTVTDTGAAGTTGVPPTTGTANNNKVLLLNISVSAEKVRQYCQINLMYDFPRGTIATVSMIEGFSCGGAAVQTTALTYEEGAGYDLAYEEYEAGGWNGKPGPYRLSSLTGTALGNFETFADPLGKYNLYSINNINLGIGGNAVYGSSLMTRIAVPTTDTTTIPALSAILHRIIDGAVGNDSTVNGLFTPEFSEVFE